MTITAAPITVSRRNAAVSASAWFHTTDPGTFACTYPTGITGPATVTAAGSRAYQLDGRGGGYVAADGIGQNRLDCTKFLKIDLNRVQIPSFGALSVALTYVPLVQSVKYDTSRKYNWFIGLRISTSGYVVYLMQSASSGSTEAVYLAAQDAIPVDGIMRIAMVFGNGNPDTNVAIYRNSRANVTNITRAATSGTMGSPEALILQSGIQFVTWSRQLSNADLDLLFADTIPATPALAYLGGHEMTTPPIVWDSAGTNDLGALTPTGFGPPSMALKTTDTGFTSPLVEIPLTIAADCTAGVHNITLRRTRVGIPARTPALSDAVVYDDGTIPVTVAVTAEAVAIGPIIDCQVPSYPATFDLQLCGNYDGSAAIVSNNASLVPASPVTISGGVAVVACTVSADVTGATVTATGPGGDTDACSVTVSEVPEELVPLTIGPSQSLLSGVTSLYLHITGEDGTATVASSPAFGLSGLPATVTISGGEADLTLTKMTPGTYAITVTQGARTASCTVTIAAAFVAATEYDLVRDVADMIESLGVAAGNAYHYDETILTETGGDLEDRMFVLQETGTTDGPIIGGKTVMLRAIVFYRDRAQSSDSKALIDYLNQTAQPPSYVTALWAANSATQMDGGAETVVYEIQVMLG